MKHRSDRPEDEKPGIITFKVDPALARAMRGVGNRSRFIREAVLQALDNGCPFCGGAGVLTVPQKRHWGAFLKHHDMKECKGCHILHPVCKK